MTQINRYLLRNLAVATVFVTAGLSATIWLTQSLRLVELVVEGGAPIRMFLHLAVLTLPTFLSLVLPFGLLAAVLFTYNRLIMDSELVVMRAAGMGPFALARPAVVLAAVVMGICFTLNIFLAPAAQRELIRLRQEIRSDYSAVLLRAGTYNDVGDGLTVYVRQRGAEGELRGLLIHDARELEKPVTIIADRGQLVTGEAGPRVVVFNGVRQELDRPTGRLSQLAFARYTVDINVLRGTMEKRWPDPRERPIQELVFVSDDKLDQEFKARLRSELHTRLATPFFGPSFALIALAALLPGEFSRRGQARRIAVAAFIALFLQSALLGLSNLATRNEALAPLMYVVVMGPLVAAAWYLRNWRLLARMRRGGRQDVAEQGA
ncbi:MAG TPA: LPS export ABC transporter permease LptF [Azospirillaceae bacterium]|nr:LPS export ABC transporter permease LptF [Azospirillaceae bacterium]